MTIDSTAPCATALVGAYESDLEAEILETNCMMQEARPPLLGRSGGRAAGGPP
jgi:hypothetical protein